MKRLICATVAGLLLVGVAVEAAPSQGKGKNKADHEKAKGKAADPSVDVHVVFVPADVTLLRNHYAPRYRNLPPASRRRSRAAVSCRLAVRRSSKRSQSPSSASFRRCHQTIGGACSTATQ